MDLTIVAVYTICGDFLIAQCYTLHQIIFSQNRGECENASEPLR